MAESKKFYSAKEAALAVLAKTEELLKAHSLSKAAVIPSLKPKVKPDDTEIDPEAEGEGGSGEGSGGGGGGAAPDEPDNFSTSGKDVKQKPAMKNDKMKKSEEEFGYQLLRKTAENISGMHNVQYFKSEKTEELFKAIAEADLTKAEKNLDQSGISKQGYMTRRAAAPDVKARGDSAGYKDVARGEATKRINEERSQPKPNLTKSASPVGKPDHSNPPKEVSAMKPASTHPEGANATPAPGNNLHEQAEGNNADWGTSPQVKGHIKLAHFIGHTSAKKKMNQPNSNIGTAMGQPAAPQSAPAAAPVKKGIALS
jgi:hypothetical protein